MTTFETEAVFGNIYRDEHTGFEGVCTGVFFYLTGCNRAALEAKADKKTGKIGDEVVFDTIRLIDIETGLKIDQPKPERQTHPGGPRTVTRRT